jgi:hypothetical protein
MSEKGTLRHFSIRDELDWGEFFVHELPPREDEEWIYHSATWCATTSFGQYGHHWTHMGEPFGQFISRVDKSYLLGKIGRKTFCDRTLVSKVIAQIREALRKKRTSFEDAKLAIDEVQSLRGSYIGEALAVHIYDSPRVNKVPIDWQDFDCKVWEPQVVGFVEKLWPKFVKEINTPRGSEPVALAA